MLKLYLVHYLIFICNKIPSYLCVYRTILKSSLHCGYYKHGLDIWIYIVRNPNASQFDHNTKQTISMEIKTPIMSTDSIPNSTINVDLICLMTASNSNPIKHSRSSQCSTTGVTKAVVCIILSVGWCI